jgi:hypothetical protein
MQFNARFYLLRLRQASIAEFGHHIRQRLMLNYLRWSAMLGCQLVKLPQGGHLDIENLRMPDLITEDPVDALRGSNISHSENLLNPWGINPISAKEDIRIAWEPARLQQAVFLLVNAHQHKEVKSSSQTLRVAKSIILSWLDANPFPRGIHFTSAMECALRIPVFFYALKLIDDLTSAETDRLLDAIYRHAFLISESLSLYSSLGNHTIAEAVGLVFAGSIYQSTRKGRHWLETGIKLLKDELPHQLIDDGGPAEQSLNYHRFVLDLYWLAMDFIQKNKLDDVAGWKPRLMLSESFWEAFMDRDGNIPSIGDSDDGFAVAPGIAPVRDAIKLTPACPTRFEHSGYSIMMDDELLITFDHGPLGMPPLYNHGHADALSITLSKHGRPFLVDSGTYRYNGVHSWRRYFKGTRAHNTVTIDGLDQAIQETSFIWSKPFQSKLSYVDENEHRLFWSASHNGYTRLENPVCHHRSILICGSSDILIQDRFTGTGSHQFELNYHLHPDVIVKRNGAWWELDSGGVQIFMRLLNGDFKTVSGADSSMLGWFSPCYGQKSPTTVLTHLATGHPDEIVLKTAIFIRKPID